MKRLIFTILVIGLFLIGGCSSSSSFSTYIDEADYFSISYPTDWMLFPLHGELISEYSKDFFKSYDGNTFSEGTNIVFWAESPDIFGFSEASNEIIIEALSGAMKMQILDEIVDAKLADNRVYVFSKKNITIDGRKAIIIDWELRKPDTGNKLHLIDMYTIKDKLLWLVTCCVNPPADFSDFEADFHSIVRSLRILK